MDTNYYIASETGPTHFTLHKGVQGFRYDLRKDDTVEIIHFHSGIEADRQTRSLSAAREHYLVNRKVNGFVPGCERNLHPSDKPCPCPDCN